jgi:hypothetical protein
VYVPISTSFTISFRKICVKLWTGYRSPRTY